MKIYLTSFRPKWSFVKSIPDVSSTLTETTVTLPDTRRHRPTASHVTTHLHSAGVAFDSRDWDSLYFFPLCISSEENCQTIGGGGVVKSATGL
jgi:hypothetical protein